MIDINKFLRDDLVSMGLLIQKQEDLELFEKNKEQILSDILNKLNSIRVTSLDIYNKNFLNYNFLSRLSKIKSLTDIRIYDSIENCTQIVNDVKDSNIKITFAFEFQPHQEEYYNQNLSSFTEYPCNFKMNSKSQHLCIESDAAIEILAKLIHSNPPEETTIEFKDSSTIIKVMDSIHFNNLTVYINDISFDNLTYIYNKYPNVKFVIKRRTLLEEHTEVSYETIKEKENFMRSVIEEVKNHNLSSFEQYMYLYNIVKYFKPYKETPNDNYLESRSPYLLLGNNYIVCEGYANLLEELVEKLNNPNIQCVKYGLYLQGEKRTGHARNLVYINDEEYGINNVFVSDPTWDSITSHKSERLKNKFIPEPNKTYDWYNHFIMTPDRISSEQPLQVLEDIALDIVNNSVDYSVLLATNKRALNKFFNSDVSLMSQHFIKEIPNKKIEKAIHKIYSIIYENYSPEMVQDIINTNTMMDDILFANVPNRGNKL